MGLNLKKEHERLGSLAELLVTFKAMLLAFIREAQGLLYESYKNQALVGIVT